MTVAAQPLGLQIVTPDDRVVIDLKPLQGL